MSEATNEPAELGLATFGDSAFAELMDTLVPDEAAAPAGEAGAPAVEAAAPAGGSAGADDAAGGAAAGAAVSGTTADPAPATGGDAGDPAATDPAPGSGDGSAAGTEAGAAAVSGGAAAGAVSIPDGWTATAASVAPQLAELNGKLETKIQESNFETALAETRKEHTRYFEAIEKHPRLLVGAEVPRAGGEGMETLRSEEDAKSWQEATKGLLVQEVKARADKLGETQKDYLGTLHQSVQLFQNNPDLVPGTKEFNVDLANRFTALAKPYEVRVEGKLHGYAVPVQPLVDHLRAQVPPAASKAAGAPAAAATKPAEAVEPPQAGIVSKAGRSGDQPEDFSTLFGTIGLPDFKI